ncbi:PP2C family protein-serine/threonine phosphatase [Nonomuraea sp. WAC 01424]|uniref:PP2C family protein-serine/threonine phosphatase n=1 Tax=Nonomuraea sp. WAC 01424 TaxID=2203200 RepID=UPI00163B95EA|nr:PP2C family protein-serine/threonine phosphatase [Nonomuraea sp. WAC 01424]
MRSQRGWFLLFLLVEVVVALFATFGGADFDPLTGLLVLAAAGGWTFVTIRAQREQENELVRVRQIAELAQQAVVRPLPPRLGGVSLAVHTRSANDQSLVGGDLHDALAAPSGVRVIVGDAKGKGMEAAHLSAVVLAAFRRHAAAAPDLVTLAGALDAELFPHLGEEDFVTVLLAEFAPGEVRLVNCGHPAPLRIGHRLEALEPPEPSPPLGLGPDPRMRRAGLGLSQRLLLYTDGLSEARDADGIDIPLDQHVRHALAAPGLDHALPNLLDLLDEHAGDLRDDLTLVLAQPVPVPDPAERVPGPAPGDLGVTVLPADSGNERP